MSTKAQEDASGEARLSAETASEALESALSAFFVVSHSGVVEFANGAACVLSGYPREELIGLGFADLVVARDLAERPLDQEGVSKGAIRNRRPIARKDGSVIWVDAVSRRASDGRVHVWARDLSVERYQEEDVRRAQRLETTGMLAAGVAHDFNNLLATIAGNAELLQEPSAGHDVVALASAIHQAADRAAHLTRQLLAFGRKQSMSPARVNLNALVEANLELIGHICGRRVRVEPRLAPELDAVWVDAGPVTQVLLNLVTNAAEAMRERGGRLLLESANVRLDASSMAALPMPRRDERFVLLRVSDDGVGMSEEVRSRMFQPFFSTREGGAGLGLSVVEGVVAQCGGIVRATSEAGTGSCVEILLPRTSEVEAVAETPLARPAAAASSDALHVLVVDDEPTLRRWLERLLASRGYVVSSAQDGEEALSMIESAASPPSLIITDLQMPRMGGAALADALARRQLALPIVFMTGYAEESAVRALPKGAQMLAKPFRSEQLLKCMQRALHAP